MQKVIRRTALARNQAKRKSIIASKEAKREEYIASLREQFSRNRMQLDAIRAERERRREDWLRGPLAPRRDVGLEADHYGTLRPDIANLPRIPKHLRRKYINIAPGDRVCIMKGRDKGKINEVTRVDPETESVTVRDLNMADMNLPDWYTAANPNMKNVEPMPMPIPIDDVRLVVPLDNPATGNTRDVLAEHVYGGEPILEREWGTTTPRHTRYIAGVDIDIPWPRSERLGLKDEPWDTSRMEVDTPNWFPSLLHPPFPPSVMDELRNKYSKYRTRHDPEWVEAKKMEDLRKEYLQTRTMLTPKGEYMAAMKAKSAKANNLKRDADGNYIIPPRTAGFIERFMQQNAQKERKLRA